MPGSVGRRLSVACGGIAIQATVETGCVLADICAFHAVTAIPLAVILRVGIGSPEYLFEPSFVYTFAGEDARTAQIHVNGACPHFHIIAFSDSVKV